MWASSHGSTVEEEEFNTKKKVMHIVVEYTRMFSNLSTKFFPPAIMYVFNMLLCYFLQIYHESKDEFLVICTTGTLKVLLSVKFVQIKSEK